MSLIAQQEKFIEHVNNNLDRPRDRKNRIRRAAGSKLYAYCMSIGLGTEQARHVCRDAWDMAELERNAED